MLKTLNQAQSQELGSFLRFAGLTNAEVQNFVIGLQKTVKLPYASEIWASFYMF